MGQPEEGMIAGTTGAEEGARHETLEAELDLAALLFSAGAPGQRIIDSITVLNEKLHGGTLHVLLGFEALVIALEHGGERRVGVRQFPPPRGMNGTALLMISRWLRALPGGRDPASVVSDLKAMHFSPISPGVVTYAALAIFTMIFGYFNHADGGALVIIALAALLAGIARELMVSRGHYSYMGVLVATLVATISSALLSVIIPTATPLVSLIIPCVFLVPGFELISGGWEVLRNLFHIGIPRLMVCINVILMMGLGVLTVLIIYTPGADGSGLQYAPAPALVIDTLLGGLCAICYCSFAKTPRQAVMACVICGMAGRLVRTVVVAAGGEVYLGVFCGTLVIAVLALLLSRQDKFPVVLPLVAASVQFMPGYYAIISLQGMAQIIKLGVEVPPDVIASTIAMGLLTFFISAAIIMGTLIPLLLLGKKPRWY